MTTANKNLDEMRTKALLGGCAKRIQKQHERGRLSARERINILVDKESSVWHDCTLCLYAPAKTLC